MAFEKTPEEIAEFLAMNELTIDSIDNNESFSTNFTIAQNNFQKETAYTNIVTEFIKFLLNQGSVDVVVSTVINKLLTDKLNFVFNGSSLPIDSSITEELYGVIYRIKKISLTEIEITCDNIVDWNPSNYMVFCKNSVNQIIYPVITTDVTKISIYIETGFTENIRIYFT